MPIIGRTDEGLIPGIFCLPSRVHDVAIAMATGFVLLFAVRSARGNAVERPS